jgi:hypothetical protein
MNRDGFTKLFGSIITSSIWSEDDKTRIMWITMLAITDADGFCSGSVVGMAAIARMKTEEAQAAIARLEAPDPYSRTPDHEGRRVQKCDGGWIVLNYPKYRDQARKEKRNEYMRNLMADKRALARKANNLLTGANPSASASASSSASASDKDFLAFWTAYPRKVGKNAALRAWKKATDKPALADILKAVAVQSESEAWKKDGSKFIPHPTKWLNDGRWADEAPAPRKNSATGEGVRPEDYK